MHRTILAAALILTSSLAIAHSDNNSKPRTVAVSGSGFAQVEPDSAIVLMYC